MPVRTDSKLTGGSSTAGEFSTRLDSISASGARRFLLTDFTVLNKRMDTRTIAVADKVPNGGPPIKPTSSQDVSLGPESTISCPAF